jgi:hypothetical protein
VVDRAELRHPEVELPLKRRQADQHRATDRVVGEPRRPAVQSRPVESVAVQVWRAASALLAEHPGSDGGERRAADHLDVGGPPQRHVLPEEGVPQVVEREARERHHAAQREQGAADTHPPRPAPGYAG